MISIREEVLTGQTVCLEPLSKVHFSELIRAGCDDKMVWPSTWPTNQHHPEVMEKYLHELLEAQRLGERVHYSVRHLPSERLVGMTSYNNFQKMHHSLEIGATWYTKKFQKTGVNTECKYLLLKHAFETVLCIRVQFRASGDNVRSIEALERIGAKYEGALRNNYIAGPKIFDLNIYSIIVEEWPAVKSKLEQMLI